MKNIIYLFLVFTQLNTGFAFPLSQIERSLDRLKQQHLRPVAIFDLDETLIHSAKRKVLSYKKAIALNRATLSQQWPRETNLAETQINQNAEALMRSLPNQYDPTLFFQRLGICNQVFVKALEALMLPIYLSNEFISEDTAYRGAVQLLDLIYQAKGEVIFVSSRFQSTQESGTIKNLVDLYLYQNSKQSFVFLRNDGERSVDFKQRAYTEIKSRMERDESMLIVGENEPENFNLLTEFFPEAFAIFVTGAIMNTEVPLKRVPSMILTKDFIRD